MLIMFGTLRLDRFTSPDDRDSMVMIIAHVSALAGDWKRVPELDRLLLFRSLRLDRLTAAMRSFVISTLGKEYAISQPFNLEASFQARSEAMLTLL
jgi:hypothetical protein